MTVKGGRHRAGAQVDGFVGWAPHMWCLGGVLSLSEFNPYVEWSRSILAQTSDLGG